MPTQLLRAQHLEGLRTAMLAFVRYADRAGLGAPVPTCPGWTVRDLVLHQGEAHRSVAAVVSGGTPPGPAPVDGDPLDWLRDGAIELVEAVTRTPQPFWVRQACHQTTVHAVDALAAALGRAPHPTETWIDVGLAVDGVDEALTRTARRPGSRLRSTEGALLVVTVDDAPAWWLVRLGATAADVRRGSGPRPDLPLPDWEVRGTAVGLYLALWERSARPMSAAPRPGPPLWSA